MKQNNIKIAIVEEGNFYNNLVDNQIFDLCNKMHYNKINWVIKSFENAEALMKHSRSSFNAMIFDSYSNGKNKLRTNTREIIDQVKNKMKDCFFISISGTREIMITAELYKDGEMCYYYLKESNFNHQNFEINLIMPVLYKLMDKMLSCVEQNTDQITQPKKISSSLRISA